MTATVIDMTEEEFDAAYTLRPNDLNPDASWAIGDGPGCLFEISPEELKFVRRQNPRTVWTLLDGEDGNLHLISGYHFVNRIGYLVTTVAVPEDVSIRVCIRMDQDIEEDSANRNAAKPTAMPADIRMALERVLEHFYRDELDHYESAGAGDSSHIFHSLNRLKYWVATQL
jgi:hypothetical protein